VDDLAGNILTSMNYSSTLVVLNPFCQSWRLASSLHVWPGFTCYRQRWLILWSHRNDLGRGVHTHTAMCILASRGRAGLTY